MTVTILSSSFHRRRIKECSLICALLYLLRGIMVIMNYKSVFILGRQPAIGRAELESLFGAEHLQPLGDMAMGCDIDSTAIPFARLGSSIRLARYLDSVADTKWSSVIRCVGDQLAAILPGLPDGKVKLGLSVFDLPLSSSKLFAAGLELKKVCKQAGRSVRVVPNNEPALSS